MEPIQVLQAFYITALISIVLLDRIPTLRTRFLNYGSRATPIVKVHQNGYSQGSTKAIKAIDTGSSSFGTRLLDIVASLQVPHGYFLHFYIASVLSSIFWAFQLLTRGAVFQAIAERSIFHDDTKGMTIDQVAVTWSLMLIQGIRRLYESIILAKPSTSKMWFVHWLLGISFYLSFGITLWIEGLPTLYRSTSIYDDITLSAPSLKTITGIPIFILASGLQYDCHAYLASLPKYTLPVHPVFSNLISPHYFAECLIYVSLAIIAAPAGAICNKTIFCALVFVGTNLAVTASASREWYEQKFGVEAVKDRRKIIPFLY